MLHAAVRVKYDILIAYGTWHSFGGYVKKSVSKISKVYKTVREYPTVS